MGLPALLAGRLPERLAGRPWLPMVERAFAVPVLAVVFAASTIRLKKPLLPCFEGDVRPPKTPADSIGSFAQSAVGVITGWLAEA